MRRGLVFSGIMLVVLVGCNANQPFKDPMPSTHKVVGIVTHSDGKPFTKGGSISFQHENEAKRGVTTSGLIKSEDGSFTLQSVTAQHNVPGAQEGSYRVTILPNSPDQSAGPIHLQKKYVVQAGENDIIVKLEN